MSSSFGIFVTFILIAHFLNNIIVLGEMTENLYSKNGVMLHPKTYVGKLFTKTLTRTGCAKACSSSGDCSLFFHNPYSYLCKLVGFGQMAVQDDTYPDIPENLFDSFINKAYPRSCWDVKVTRENVIDEEYWLYPVAFHGKKAKIFCYGMSTATPQEYVSLLQTNYGDYPPEQNLNCNGETHCVTCSYGHVVYSKIRVNVNTMTVQRDDKTFSSGSGSYVDFGSAEDCYNTIWSTPTNPPFPCGPKGKFLIDTTGTGLIFTNETTWTVHGYQSGSFVSRSSGGRVVDITCGGWCGGCDPDILRLEPDPAALP